MSEQDPVAQADELSARLHDAQAMVQKVVLGQERVIEQVMVTLLSGGHALLVGLPGLAKTRLVVTLGTVLGLDANRVQFTPDLLPSDILGAEILDQAEDGSRHLRFIKGPVFAQLLMADEINRASPRTQSALLQAMQEHHVTIAGQHYDLPSPFHVLATQNPIEQEGTYPLPEAQLDRFLLQINVEYPERDAERTMLVATTGTADTKAEAVLQQGDLQAAQKFVRSMPIGESVLEAILDVVRAARPGTDGAHDAARHLAWGPGPRAGQALMLTVRARALLQGRLAPSVDDVLAMAPDVLRHRMALTYPARAEGQTIHQVIDALTAELAAA